MSQALEQVLQYHQATKHRFDRFARGPGRLDWATQPDPFRRYRDAAVIELDRGSLRESPPYEIAFLIGRVEPAPLNRRSVSQLFFDSLAVSAWKRAGDVSWALRVNPSSGNLHPTEGYLLCGMVDGLSGTPLVAHYTPQEHALEVRAKFSLTTWKALTADLPTNTILIGLSSIHWREAWKYGERAFRYCQLDVGHAVAALNIAAAALGWQTTLLDDLGSEQIAQLLGLTDPQGAEPEHPDCLLAIYPQGRSCSMLTLPWQPLRAFADLVWQGRPNELSPPHVDWPIIEQVAIATEKPPTERFSPPLEAGGDRGRSVATEARVALTSTSPSLQPLLRQIVRQRRSAVAMNPQGRISREDFYRILRQTLPGPDRFPFNSLPWTPSAHLALFVHRVDALAAGLYLLARNPEQKANLQAAMSAEFSWEKPPSCPADLDLYQLAAGDVRNVARQLSCRQAIASDGCFSLGMIVEFEKPLERWGAWFYRRLFWECGMIGQALYLEAEAVGLRGTGIGCFFDDAVHRLLGLEGQTYHSLYHFTVGHPVEDTRLTTLRAYPDE